MQSPIIIYTGHYIPPGITLPIKCSMKPITYYECYYPERQGIRAGYAAFKAVYDKWLKTRATNPTVSLWIATEETRLLSWFLQQLEALKLTSLVTVVLYSSGGSQEFSVDTEGVISGGWPYGCLEVTPDDLTGPDCLLP